MIAVKPITRVERFAYAIVNGQTIDLEPVTREERYLDDIMRGVVSSLRPVTRLDYYLAKISGADVVCPVPVTRLDRILAKLAGMDVPEQDPVTRLEKIWADAAYRKVYTAVWDREHAQMTRAGDAAGITTTVTDFKYAGAVNPSYNNPFDALYPWSGRILVNIDLDAYRALQPGDRLEDCISAVEGEAGFSYEHDYGVWVYTPEFYGRHRADEEHDYFDVADGFVRGEEFVHYPAQITGRWFGQQVTLNIDGTEKPCLLPKLGLMSTRTSLLNMHNYAKNYGGSIVSVYELDASLLLYLVEYANFDAQTAVGFGVDRLHQENSDHPVAASSGSVVSVAYNSTNVSNCIPGAILDIGTENGGNQRGTYVIQEAVQATDDQTVLLLTIDRDATVDVSDFWSIHGLSNIADAAIGSKSGYIGVNGTSAAYYRGEELWSNKWGYIVGAYHQASTNRIWLAKDAKDADLYDAINISEHIDSGIAISSTNDYIKSLSFPGGTAAVALCTMVGGSSTNPVGDYFYNNPNASTVLLVGGFSNAWSRAGPFFWGWYTSAGSSAWGLSARPRLTTP